MEVASLDDFFDDIKEQTALFIKPREFRKKEIVQSSPKSERVRDSPKNVGCTILQKKNNARTKQSFQRASSAALFM